jgi:two-component system, NarL family, nitrate/nitrite response regulator NarL
MIRIIVADDHPIFINGVRTALEAVPDIKIIGEATDGLQLLHLLDIIKVDLVLLDINMPGMDGIQAAEIIKRRQPATGIIMLTQYDERRFMKKCREIGVEGYLLKGIDKDDLVKAIINIFNGGIQYMTDKKSPNEFPVPGLMIEIQITTKEKEVLKLIAEDKCNSEIAQELNIKQTTVKTHKRRMLWKTGAKTITGLVVWAFRKRIIK